MGRGGGNPVQHDGGPRRRRVQAEGGAEVMDGVVQVVPVQPVFGNR